MAEYEKGGHRLPLLIYLPINWKAHQSYRSLSLNTFEMAFLIITATNAQKWHSWAVRFG